MDVQWLIEELGLDFLPASFLIYQGFIFAPTLYGQIFYKHLSKPYQLLAQMLVLVFLLGWVGRWAIAQFGVSTPSSHFVVLVNLVYYGLIYYSLLKGSTLARRIILVLATGFLLLSILNSFYYSGLMTMPSIGIVLIAVLAITSSLLLYQYELRNPVEISIFKQPAFWFNTGNLIFYGTTIFVFGFYNYMTYEMGGMASWMETLISYSNYILYSSYFVCLYLEVRSNRAKHLQNER